MVVSGAPQPERDFILTVERAAGLALEASIAARAARRRPISAPRRRHVRHAIGQLERAQEHLWRSVNTPATCPPPRQQLELEI